MEINSTISMRRVNLLKKTQHIKTIRREFDRLMSIKKLNLQLKTLL